MYKRLRSTEFQKVIRGGAARHSTFFFLRVAKNSLQQKRVGVAVSKQLAKKASQRNYYKRVLRHLLKETISAVPAGYDIILIARPNIKNQRFAILKKDVQDLFYKIHRT